MTGERVVFDQVTPEIAEAFVEGHGDIVRVCDIYYPDNETVWRENVGLLSGAVSVDSSRAERRVLECELAAAAGELVYGTGENELWYDKIIKPYRGVRIGSVDYVTPLGEFQIDRITRPHHPETFQISGRDFAKVLLNAKLPGATTFAASTSLEDAIYALAVNGGISADRINFPATGVALAEDIPFDPDTPRLEAMTTICSAYGHEVFFDNFGFLILRPFVDPVTAPVSHTFATGAGGNLASYRRSSDDSRLFNHVAVYGSGQTNGLVYGEAENTAPDSPTRISRIGRRTMPWPSQVVPDNITAASTALSLLGVAALEQFDVELSALVAPWLREGTTIEFLPDDYNGYDPTRFLLTTFNIPLAPEPMSANAKRVHIVGA